MSGGDPINNALFSRFILSGDRRKIRIAICAGSSGDNGPIASVISADFISCAPLSENGIAPPTITSLLQTTRVAHYSVGNTSIFAMEFSGKIYI